MVPERFRTRTVLLGGASLTTILGASPAFALNLASISSNQILSVTPFAIAGGAAAFGAVSAFFAYRARRRGNALANYARRQLRDMRAHLDELEGLLAGMREVTLIWREHASEPQVFGPVSLIIDGENDPAAILDLERWLPRDSVTGLSAQLATLRAAGVEFSAGVRALGGAEFEITGRLVAGAPVVRISPKRGIEAEPFALAGSLRRRPTIESCTALISCLNHPAWIRDSRGALAFVNAPYLDMLKTLGKTPGPDGQLPELFDRASIERHRKARREGEGPVSLSETHPQAGPLDVTLFSLEDGAAGYAVQGAASNEAQNDPALSFLTAAINELATPVAVFDADGKLTHYNKAFADLWGLDQAWLETGPNEGQILDRLRTSDMLPAEADYRAWRKEHLKSYGLEAPRESMWHLPNGQVLNVIASPAPKHRGVIYVYENVTERLALESQHNSLIEVQRETLNGLSEAVAVFGTDGKLKLHNPQLSGLWGVDMKALSTHPHIDAIAKACAEVMPEDGARIWGELKQAVIDMDPNRRDAHGRLSRADGKLIDYAIVRLPNGQSLVSFVDVTQAAQYEQLLKERNEALETADKLKDAFVQNVSYELRSPLTNIIGFSDLLANEELGPLNDRQREYTAYIRSSSEALGILIDNILDLASADAGIAELQPEILDIEKLIEKAQAGALATSGSESPVNIEVDIADDLPVFIADETRIVQVLYNLLSNAVRYSDPGATVKIAVSSRGGERIIFTVDDEGAGIPEELVRSVFDRFEGHAVQGRQRGAGLGLAIVKTFVHLHSGTVQIAAREPRGTRVIVNLPARQSRVVPAEGASPAE